MRTLHATKGLGSITHLILESGSGLCLAPQILLRNKPILCQPLGTSLFRRLSFLLSLFIYCVSAVYGGHLLAWPLPLIQAFIQSLKEHTLCVTQTSGWRVLIIPLGMESAETPRTHQSSSPRANVSWGLTISFPVFQVWSVPGPRETILSLIIRSSSTTFYLSHNHLLSHLADPLDQHIHAGSHPGLRPYFLLAMLSGASHHPSHGGPHSWQGSLEQFLFHSQGPSGHFYEAFSDPLDRNKISC